MRRTNRGKRCASRSGSGLLVAIAVVLGCTLAAGAARAGHDDDEDLSPGGRACTATTLTLALACENGARDDFLEAKAICINLGEAGERAECLLEAKQARLEARTTCREQRAARRELCGALGEARYDPDFDAADFDADFANPAHSNPYFPVTIGHRWEYVGSDEVDHVEILDATKSIDELTCVVQHDRVEQTDGSIEDTFDWFAQKTDRSVVYCGESSADFQVFPGDVPPEPELVTLEGSWKMGRDGAVGGYQFLGAPTPGRVYRQEFAPGTAEDAARVISITYGFGLEPELDAFVPQELADVLCAGDCVVTGEFSPLEPQAFQRKYYAPQIGLFLEVDPESGDTLQLVDCNFDAKCAELPAP